MSEQTEGTPGAVPEGAPNEMPTAAPSAPAAKAEMTVSTKIALAAAAGFLGGALLLGAVFGASALIRGIASRGAWSGQGRAAAMMGPGYGQDFRNARQGMMGRRFGGRAQGDYSRGCVPGRGSAQGRGGQGACPNCQGDPYGVPTPQDQAPQQ